MKKIIRKLSLIISLFFLLINSLFCNENNLIPRVYLYGESHCNKIIIDAELKVWQNFYNNQKMRHLFIEYDYSTAQLLNKWMKEKDDTILNQVYKTWKGAIAYNEDNLAFYKNIKLTCPETIFHGIDVGPRPDTTDLIYLHQLENEGKTGSKEYQIVLENIEQAKHFKTYNDMAIRENYMAANFIREFDSLPENEKIMGIFGSAHITYVVDPSGKVPSLIAQLRKNYNYQNKDFIQDYDISNLADWMFPPLGIEYFSIKGRTYKATYYGEENVTSWWNGYKTCKTWRIENPDEYLAKLKRKRIYFYYSNFSTTVNQGDVFRLEVTKQDGSKQVLYYRADDKIHDGKLSTNLIFRE